jgi:hypothetical protein
MKLREKIVNKNARRFLMAFQKKRPKTQHKFRLSAANKFVTYWMDKKAFSTYTIFQLLIINQWTTVLNFYLFPWLTTQQPLSINMPSTSQQPIQKKGKKSINLYLQLQENFFQQLNVLIAYIIYTIFQTFSFINGQTFQILKYPQNWAQ